MPSDADRRAVRALEAACEAVLTLTEGLERAQLAGSRLTKLEVRRQLLSACEAQAGLSAEARRAMAELDFEAWSTAREHLQSGGPVEADALWLASESLAPATLGWLRVYRSQTPALFTLVES